MINNLTYLVTGGCGFIGSNFIHYMLEKYGDSITIVNLDALTYAGNLQNLADLEDKKNLHFVKGDICDTFILDAIFDNFDIDRVIHFAAESHVDRSIKNPDIFIKTNVEGTLNLLNVAKFNWLNEDGSFMENKKFIHVSTDEVYGSLNLGEDTYFYEDTPYNPHSPYAASKASSDLLVKSYVDTYGFPAVITNCSNNYGPYQFPEKLIPLVINNIMNSKPIPIYGDGKNVRDWLYVKDHCSAIDLVSEKGIIGEKYNIGGNNEKENIEVVNTIINTIKVLTAKVEHVTDRLGHDRRYAICSDKIQTELGWKPEYSFEDGIRETIEWYIQNNKWMKSVTSGEYQRYYEEMYGEVKE